MKKYLEFLIKFALQNEEFRESELWKAYHLDKIVVAGVNEPLILIDVNIKKRKITSKTRKVDSKQSKAQRKKTIIYQDDHEYIRIVDMTPRIEEVYFHFV